ncbi:MAG TPA: GNAT family N-acetyltransferase [Actinomycetota bacterium]|nr:GNAT family N-acetyltransferase [Actinomycetota bacterium]
MKDLPHGLEAKPITEDDLDAVVAMVNACELHDTGELMLERADLLADAGAEGFDPGADWLYVSDGERIVAWGLLDDGRRATVDVHPDVRGRGIGTWLRRWSEERAREVGAPRVRQTVDDRRADVVAMLTAAGYVSRGTSWILRMDHPERPAPPDVPAGVEFRAFRPFDEDEALAMFERAFIEFEDRAPSPASTWRPMVTRREGFEPEDLVVAVADGRIVGGAFLIDADEIWVDKLAVAREHRHRGIARALLQTAFARSFDRGYTWTSLSTDSRTGALFLYERLGMTIHRSFSWLVLDL